VQVTESTVDWERKWLETREMCIMILMTSLHHFAKQENRAYCHEALVLTSDSPLIHYDRKGKTDTSWIRVQNTDAAQCTFKPRGKWHIQSHHDDTRTDQKTYVAVVVVMKASAW
jgi:hypothetical protein